MWGMPNYAKQRIALRYWLSGAGFWLALDAFEFAADFHSGTRKDGVTPEFSHQVAIALYLRTLQGSLMYPEETLAVAMLHDVREDYDVEAAVIEARFGPIVANGVAAMTKEFKGVKRDPHEVFAAIAMDPVASVVKPADRVHNQASLLGVFTPEKARSYVAETNKFFFPLLREARRRFPRQEPAYENEKLVLEGQVALLAALYPKS
jgi:(p)ppGpp synthase/HD superfamily hydrolase